MDVTGIQLTVVSRIRCHATDTRLGSDDFRFAKLHVDRAVGSATAHRCAQLADYWDQLECRRTCQGLGYRSRAKGSRLDFAMRESLVQVKNLGIGFTSRAEVTLPILRNIDLAIGEGETIGLVGESGCGKSTLALAMMGYLKSGLRVLEGDSLFRGRNVFDMDKRTLEDIRGGELALIPQNAGQSLTPTSRIGRQINESVKLHTRLAKGQRRERVIELLSQVRLPQPQELRPCLLNVLTPL